MGMTFSRLEDYDTAYNCFNKATKMDPHWRDGFVWRGYTEMKLNQPKQALETLKTAEKIDPIYPLTYQLLVIAYQQTGDTVLADRAQEKLGYLSKSYTK